jgi:hypothetical protein
VRVTLTLNITAITGSWLYRCYDRTGGVWLDSITITTTGLKVLSFIAPSSNLEPTLTSSGSDTISIDAGSSENSFYPHSGLVAAYNMTLDTDGGVTDLTGNGNDGTNNGCLPSEDGLVFGGAEYVDLDALIPSISSNTIGSISTVITPKTSIPAANEQIISFSDTDVNERMQFWVGTDGKIYASCRVANVTKWTFATDNAVVSGLTNSTISLIHDGVSPILIIDGVEVPQTFSDSTDKTVWFSALTGLDNGRVGCNNLNGAGNDLFFNGQVLDVKIYNRALTAQEVIDYHNSFILPTLVETFDEGADGIAKLPREWIAGTGTYKIDQWNVAQGETVTNGGFDTDSDWTKGTGWTISSGKAHANISSGTPILRQNDIGYRVGHRYRVKFTISNLTSGAIKVDLGAGVSSFTASANGSYSEVLMGAVEADLRFYPPASDFVGSIDNVSVVEIDYANDGSGIYYEPIKSGDKYLECTVAGTIATLSHQAFGTWEWDMYKLDASEVFVLFTASVVGNRTATGQDGYYLGSSNAENLILGKNTDGTPSALYVGANGIINASQWYHYKVTKIKPGVMSLLVDGVLVAASSGSNPVTDTSFSTSVFTVLDNDAGDRVANFTYKDEIQQ